MSNAKKKRIAFLDDFCEAFGIPKADSRRSIASQIYIVYGEEACRDWLERSNKDLRIWNSLVGGAKRKSAAGSVVSSMSKSRSLGNRQHQTGTKTLTRRKRSKFRRKFQPFVGTAKNLDYQRSNSDRHKALVKRVQRRASTRQNRPDRHPWRVTDASGASSSSKPVIPDVTPTMRNLDPAAELAILRRRLEDAESRTGAGSEFIRESLKEQIALLKGELKFPKM